MAFNLKEIIHHMGPLGAVVGGFLILMGIACIGVVIERLIALGKSAKQSMSFAGQAGPLVTAWDLDGVIDLAAKYPASALARVLGSIARKYKTAAEGIEGGLSALEFARNEAERAKEAVGADLRKGLNVLATTGSVAPFIGLLGTVVGIIAAFQGIASSGSGGIGAISAGISEALIETALGLLVAIPAVLFFNYLTAKINGIEMALARSAGEFIDEMENHHGRKSFERGLTAAA
jgi:biopolymer transport protein ExbB